MADQAVSRKLELRDAHPGAFDCSLIQRRRLNVHNEVSFPNMLHAQLVALLAHFKKVFAARVAIRKTIRAVKNEILIVKNIHDHRGVRNREELDRLATAIDQLVPRVQRRSKQARRSPFKHLLAAAFLPYFSSSLSLQNADHFFIEMLLGLEGAASGNLSRIHAGHALHPVKIHKRRPPSRAIPLRHLDVPDIFQSIPLNDRNILSLHPLKVSGLFKRRHQIFNAIFSGHKFSLVSFPFSELANFCDCLHKLVTLGARPSRFVSEKTFVCQLQRKFVVVFFLLLDLNEYPALFYAQLTPTSFLPSATGQSCEKN